MSIDTQPTDRTSEVLPNAVRMLVALFSTGLILKFQGRVFWCECGTFVPWSWDVSSMHNSQHLIDPYFFSHVLHGFVFFAPLHWLCRAVSLQKRFWAAVLFECAWEVLENSPLIIERYRAVTVSLGYFGDSIANSSFDILACALGFLMAVRLKPWLSVTFFMATEIAMIVAIRDCLTLNVLMLITPIEAIKDWQMGA
jgi:hypothetical protein